MESWTCEVWLSLARHSRTFHKALIFTTESLASPAHADGLHWEGGGQTGTKEGPLPYCWSRRHCLLDVILVLAVSSNVPLLQEQWIAPATWKRTILAWMGWTMTCFTLMTLDLQVSLVR